MRITLEKLKDDELEFYVNDTKNHIKALDLDDACLAVIVNDNNYRGYIIIMSLACSEDDKWVRVISILNKGNSDVFNKGKEEYKRGMDFWKDMIVCPLYNTLSLNIDRSCI